MRRRPQLQTQRGATSLFRNGPGSRPPPKERDSRTPSASPRHRRTSSSTPASTAHRRIPHGEDLIPEACDFAVTSCLRPASGNTCPGTTRTPNLAEYETLKKTFLDTANRCHQKGTRFTAKVFEHFGHLEISMCQRNLPLHTKRHQRQTGSTHLLVT